MKVTTRIAASYVVAAGTVVATCALVGVGAALSAAYIERSEATHRQVEALHEVRALAATEWVLVPRGDTGRQPTTREQLDEALRVVESRTRAELAVGSVDQEEEADELDEYLPRILELGEQIRAEHHRGEDPSDALAERDELIAEWLDEEREELQAAAEGLRAPMRRGAVAAALLGLAGLAALGVLSHQTVGSVRRSLTTLGDGAARIGSGELDQAIVLPGHDELSDLADILNRLMVDLRSSRSRVDTLSTELVAQNARLADALAEAQAATAHARRANAAKDQFLANMSHELRTPLNAILGYTELVAEELAALDSRAVEDCERILTAGRMLLSLINDVLDVAKISAGRVELALEPVDVGRLVVETVDALRPLADRNGNALRVEVEGTGVLVTDPYRLRQILVNLTGNACKFTRSGEVRVVVRAAPAGVELEVRDTGVGIPHDKLDAIFEPFVQADPTTTRRFGGTGLGLAIVKQLIELMGGHIEVESRVGLGTTFTVHLPSGQLGGGLAEVRV
ncbi:MAG: ATP-binding protein [Myxococcota bacterium]